MQLDIKQIFISGFIIINCGSGGDSRKRTNPNMLTVTFVSIINIIVPKKNERDIPSQRKAWNLNRICETHQKNTSPSYSSIIGIRGWPYHMANLESAEQAT